MRRRAALAGIVGIVAVACSDAVAEGDVGIDDAWARPTPPGVSVGAVYLRVDGAAGDELVGASVEPAVAAGAQLHSTATTDGMATMREQVAIEVPDDGTLVLEPVGDHVMLVDLAAPLDAGETFPLTLEFAGAGAVTVDVEVREDAP